MKVYFKKHRVYLKYNFGISRSSNDWYDRIYVYLTKDNVENTPEERSQLGIPENLIRCSVGIEHTDDIKNDFDQALNAI